MCLPTCMVMKMNSKLNLLKWMLLLALLFAQPVHANISVAQAPLYLGQIVPPLTMLVMGRDHTLYYEAYNDATDLTGDGVPDIGYKPDEIDYLGLFDSFKCYSYDSVSSRFTPESVTINKKCTGTHNDKWSGDFLNYLTTSRIDALRVVLYGGTRHVDTSTQTILGRAYIPQDAHSWGKEYTSIAVDGYDIRDYTPYNLPPLGDRHLFASTSELNNDPNIPRLRVLLNQSHRIWEWVSIERPVAGNRLEHGGTGPIVAPINFTVRVEVCKVGLLESNCKYYPDGVYKPTGLLHDFGENDSMLFGLLSGSYQHNLSGGVLRSNMGSITGEIDADTGQFLGGSGVIANINRLATVGFGGSHEYNVDCGWITTRAINQGECRMWGNPIAEMLYETTRYFAGKSAATPAFATTGGDDDALGLTAPAWQDPFEMGHYCSAAATLVISGVNPSYDTDQLPGTAFGSFTGDLPGLNVSALADKIWEMEYGTPGFHFIGQTTDANDGAPTAKEVSSFNIRGLAPEEPTKMGGYYSASITRYGLINDIRDDLPTEQNISTFIVGLSSTLPRIEFPVGDGMVSIIPYAKSVSGSSISALKEDFQPTNTIVDYYIEEMANFPGMSVDASVNGGLPYGLFRVNFEDVEQGADHDMDAIVRYEIKANADNTVTVELRSEYAAGSIEQHMGYLISGTTDDGLYLEVRDCDTANPSGNDPSRHIDATNCSGDNPSYGAGMSRGTRYYLNTPNWGTLRPDNTTGADLAPVLPGECDSSTPPTQCTYGLPLRSARVFTPSAAPAATLLDSPLYYAAKYGKVSNPLTEEWDTTGDGRPDNYFLVTNPALLRDQLATALNQILDTVGSSASISTNSTRLDSDSFIYQARFDSLDWSGQLLAYKINMNGSVGGIEWEASELIPAHGSRSIYTYDGSDGLPFNTANFNNLSAEQRADLISVDILNYLRGDQSNEGVLRTRNTLLGDIVNSDPWFVGRASYGYGILPGIEGEEYTNFINSSAIIDRTPMLYVGANDGMLHAFHAGKLEDGGGVEQFAYVPKSIYSNLASLADPNYTHKYFVDGAPRASDVYIDVGNGGPEWRTILVGSVGAGGRGIYALDVTDPDNFDQDNVLWEYSYDAADCALASPIDPDRCEVGELIGQPSIVRLNNGRWGVVFGNGYNSDSRSASLFIIDAETGDLIRRYRTVSSNEESGLLAGLTPTTIATRYDANYSNGMATPIVIDYDGDRIADRIYAGDLYGNLWRVDIRDNDVANTDDSSDWVFPWTTTHAGSGGPAGRTIPQPLFTAVDRDGLVQPITGKPQVGRTDGGYMVFFGTGKYFSNDDNIIPADPQVQSFYGIKDLDVRVTGRDSDTLLKQEITHEFHETFYDSEGTGHPWDVRVVSDHLMGTESGWFLDLIPPPHITGEGERVVSMPLLWRDRIIFVTLIPDPDPCAYGGTGWIMEIDPKTGGRLGFTVFDLNRDGAFNEDEYVQIGVDDEGNPIMVPVSGVRSKEGIIKTPGVISADGVAYKYTSGSTGVIEVIENAGETGRGRQSWQQLR